MIFAMAICNGSEKNVMAVKKCNDDEKCNGDEKK